MQVVEQCPDWAKVENAQASPIFAQHAREDRQDRGFGFSPGGRRYHYDVVAAQAAWR